MFQRSIVVGVKLLDPLLLCVVLVAIYFVDVFRYFEPFIENLMLNVRIRRPFTLSDLSPSTHTHHNNTSKRCLSSRRWRPPLWEYPSTDVLDFSNLLVPTMDSTRALFLLRMLHKQRKAVLMVGAEGTAKTSTALMFFTELDPVKTAVKRFVPEEARSDRGSHTL